MYRLEDKSEYLIPCLLLCGRQHTNKLCKIINTSVRSPVTWQAVASWYIMWRVVNACWVIWERGTLLISYCLLLFLSQIWLETITQLHDRFEIQPYIRQREKSLVDNHGQSVLIRLKQDLVRTVTKKRKRFFNDNLLQFSTLHFFNLGLIMTRV